MSKDKFKARDIEKKCKFKYHNYDFIYFDEKVTSTWVVIFNKDRKIS